MVILFIDDAWTCHGIIISEDYILTSGACVYEASYVDVIAGAYDIDDITEPGQVWMTSYTAFAHENFDGLSNNVGLVKLPISLQFNKYVKAVCLPAGGDVAQEGEMVTATGWTSQTMQTFDDLLILSDEECSAVYGDLGAQNGCTQHQVCGLSSFPLVKRVRRRDQGDKWTQVGLVSMGPSSGCGTQQTTVFTRTEYFLDWIQAQIGFKM